jgi:hypothetical protein
MSPLGFVGNEDEIQRNRCHFVIGEVSYFDVLAAEKDLSSLHNA